MPFLSKGDQSRVLQCAEVFYVLCLGFNRVFYLDRVISHHPNTQQLVVQTPNANVKKVPTVPGSSLYETADRTSCKQPTADTFASARQTKWN